MNKDECINLEALRFHSDFPSGKIAISVTKCLKGKSNLAYSPGVAAPCLEIASDARNATLYTNLGNSIAIISNGTAVLGLGNIGALASKPVMEGKSALFKTLGGVDCIDIEVNESDPTKLIEHILAISCTFGGINLEDIAAPSCFEIEKVLKSKLSIPIFHDDQHGTAIIACAALINAAELTNKTLSDMKVVCIGAGAAGIACLNLMITIGIKKANIILFDSKGCVHEGRLDLNEYKRDFVTNADITLEQALIGADLFLGTSAANILKAEWLKGMNANPLILALANPVPEINPDDAKLVRPDAIICTGRGDFQNQVNNVLCFPCTLR